MIGSIIGDIVGSVFEFDNYLDKDFDLFNYDTTFTDDTVLTIALAKSFLESKDNKLDKEILVKNFQDFGRRYPDRGYGFRFYNWIFDDDPKPYGSIGNGSAMRVSPVAYVATSKEEAKELAKLSAEVTHNDPEGIRGAQATAIATYMALNGATKEEIIEEIKENYYHNDFGNSFTIDNIRPDYEFDATCDGSVPHAIECFYEGKNYEDVIRTAISLGGDSDTIAAIAGGIAGAYYEIPKRIERKALSYIDPEFEDIIEDFNEKFIESKK